MRVIATVFVAAALVAGRVEASRDLSESPKPTPSPMCETCEEFVTMGEAYLNDPATLNAITDKVNEVCETYAGTKHEAMVRCRPTPFLPPSRAEPSQTDDRLERACNFQIWKNSGRIRSLTSAVTSSRPDPFLPLTVPPRVSPRPIQCESMLEMYVQKAIDVINTDYTPDVLCAEAKLCPGDEPSEADEARVATEPTEIPASLREVIERGSAVDAPAPPHPSTDCLKCEFGVESLHAAITSNATVQSIMNEAEKACEKYAAAFDMSATCEAAIETYGPELVDAAGKYIEDAHKVCSELGMCIPPSSETVVTELGEAEAKRLRRRERMKKLKARAMAVAGLKLKNIALI